MISKEEANQLQKLTPSIPAVHSAAARVISENRSGENRPSLNIFMVSAADDEGVWIKTVL
ncbi:MULTISPECIES: hypothetical protein [unclassified Chryseobacterium]|uniref:hypothetical protein n=1 Tax=unclassified Chryseobacterium TaxID=2593645 RepID=UPI00285303E4|nr:hypothetical protein [Chryseobacterium sp. CFS7]MDR4890909.1 hypothetical protein [Chryseobacterium sp. CFS7]